MGVQKRMKTIKNYIYMKKKYLTPKITVAELASGGNYLEELALSIEGPKQSDDDDGWLHNNAKENKGSEWDDAWNGLGL